MDTSDDASGKVGSAGATPLRQAVVFTWVWILVIGQGVATISGREMWPFSPYPMYARIRDQGPRIEEVRYYRVFLNEGVEREEQMHSATLRTKGRQVLRETRRPTPQGDRLTGKQRRAIWDTHLGNDVWFPFRSPLHSDRQAGLVGIRAYLYTYDNSNNFDPEMPLKRELLGQTMRGRPRPTTTRATTAATNSPATSATTQGGHQP